MTNLEAFSPPGAAGEASETLLAFEQTEKHPVTYMYQLARPNHSWLWSTAGKWPLRAEGVK